MRIHQTSLPRWIGLSLMTFSALICLSLPPVARHVAAQSDVGVSRPWTCWAMSIAESSIFRPVVPDGVCEAVPAGPHSIHLTPRPPIRRAMPIVAPGAPTSLVGSVSGGTVALAWTAPSGGDPPTSYVLEAGSASGLSDLASSDSGSATPALTATNVPPGTYFVRIRARNSSGTSAPSNEITVTVVGACSTAPGSPVALIVVVNGSAVTLTWQAPSGGCAPTTYMIEAGSAPGLSNLASFSTGSAESLFTASGVPEGTYYVRVRSVNAGGTSGPSNEVQISIGPCAGAPATPIGLTAQISGSTVVLSWSAPAGSPSSYIVEVGSSSGSSNLAVIDTGNLATFLIATADPGTYYVRLRARNTCGTSAPSGEIIVVVTLTTSCATISPTSQSVGDSATIGSVAVTAPGSCSWTATSNASFISITSGSSGTGSGTVSYSVAANTTQVQRTGTLTIAEQTFTVTQQVCGYVVSPLTVLVAAGGGTSTIAMSAPSGCTWAVQNNAAFITLTSPTSGAGSSAITFSVQPNSDVVRGGTLIVADQTVKVVQDGPAGSTSCVVSLAYCNSGCSAKTFDGSGGTLELALGAPNTCAWIATPTVPWVAVYSTSVLAQPYGLGAGHFGFSVAPNPTDAQRTGAIMAGGHTFPITQLACAHAVSPTAVNVLASGGTAVITVTTSCTATWTATSNASFMTITGGSSGTGNGSVSVVIASNSGSARTGTLTIADQTVTVTQSGP